MRRPVPILLNVLTAVSLLLCVAASLAWRRSRTNLDRIYWLRPAGATSEGPAFHSWRASVYWGLVEVTYARYPVNPDATRAPMSWARDQDWGLHRRHFDVGEPLLQAPPPGLWRRLGFGPDPNASPSRVFAFPLWVPAAMFLVLPAARSARFTGRAWRARSRRRAGLCPACGYDRRATPGRCPECGTAAGGRSA
jgi:hypothetical protein